MNAPRSISLYFRDARHWAEWTQVFIHFGLVIELREFAEGLLEFGCISLRRVGSVFCQVDLAEGSGAEFADEFEVFADDEIWIIGAIPGLLLDICF